MKKICIKVGNSIKYKHIWASDISKIYYIKKRVTPKLPKFTENFSDFE